MRVLLIGSAVAAMAGTMAGQYAQPVLRLSPGEMPMAAVSSLPSGADSGDPGYAAYNGQIPDYVIGTDWLHPAEAPPPVEVVAEAGPSAPPAPPDARYVATAQESAPRAEPSYPSTSGDIMGGANARPATPPGETGEAAPPAV